MKIIKRMPRVKGQSAESDRWRTPRALFEKLDAEFHFDIDLAADAENHLCDRWLGPGGLAEDALAVDWPSYGTVGWLNMPYSTELILQFFEALARHGRHMTIVTLNPLDPTTEWWEFTRSAFEIRELPDRVSYIRSDGVKKVTAMFPGVVCVYRPQPGILRAQPRRVTWTWKTEEERAKRKRRLPALLEARGTR